MKMYSKEEKKYLISLHKDISFKGGRDNEAHLEVEYSSKYGYDCETCKLIEGEISNYLYNEFDFKTNNIVDIVNKIREITKDFPEEKLKVSINRPNYVCRKEWVEYIGGYLESVGAYEKIWDDVTCVRADYRGVSVTFTNDQMSLDRLKTKKDINKILSPFYDKVIALSSMTKIEKQQSYVLKKR